jgi:predicted nucleotidyltransferase
MKYPIGIEGDYLLTKNSRLYFDVKGIHHPDDRKISFIRFYPSKEGDRIKNGKMYKKIYDLKERYSFLKANYPQYLFFSKQWDLELQAVKNEEIEHIYSPRIYFQSLYNKKALTPIETTSKKLCELFIEEGDIPDNSIGITGSQMVGLNTNQSDIDLVIYGTKNSLKFQKSLEIIFKTSNKCRMYNQQEYSKHYNWRVGGSDIPYEKFLQTEMRKLHQGKYQGIDFFIRYLKSPEDWKGNYYDYQFQNLGRIHMKVKIKDSTDSIFTPCNYKIEPLEILSYSNKERGVSLERINEICSYRGRFCEQAIENETIIINGKLERVQFKHEQEYFRILLENQITDKMIVIT